MTSDIRASDKDREQVVTRLRSAVGEGLLTLTEADERMTTAYAARYRHELDQLTADLPPEPRPRQRPRIHPRAAFVAALAAVLVLLVASHGHLFFLLIPLLFLTLRFSGGPRRWHHV